MTSTGTTSYDLDFYAWTEEQAGLLRTQSYAALDLVHLIEEIEDLGKREKRGLRSRLAVLLGHLLKWRYQSDYPNKKSWRATINTQRRAVVEILRDNPSLRPRLNDFIADTYPDAVDLAVGETPLDYSDFPQTCPWDKEYILGDNWPDA